MNIYMILMGGEKMNKDIYKLSAFDIFSKDNYQVPIYQRNYAWEEVHIEQLLDDIQSIRENKDEEYFLGNLIVNQIDNDLYEVIDGQQRLTTLYLLSIYLEIPIRSKGLRFEARKKSNMTLEEIRKTKGGSSGLYLAEELIAEEIKNGFSIIKNYFKRNGYSGIAFKNKLKNTFIVRIEVPQNIDLNHYFEIMNTRGEQLELHEIAKANIISRLDEKEDKRLAAIIWDSCSNMNSYVQMNFDVKVRDAIFGSSWTNMKKEIKRFDDIVIDSKESDKENEFKLLSIVKEQKNHYDNKVKDIQENERFESTISFPNFLLQVNAVIKGLGEDESTLDDKYFLLNLEDAWHDKIKAKEFLFNMLKLRVLFDKFILKREYARDYKEVGRWSLQKLEKYVDAKGEKPKYIGTINDENENRLLRTLQSCLRITYTSPKTMHWISLVLRKLLEDENVNIRKLLEDYCSEKVKNSTPERYSGFEIKRIVFTYLDYLLYREGYKYSNYEVIKPRPDNWQFQYRNSIEHFYPQNPAEVDTWEDINLNSFGNLALITISGNSRFSNLTPSAKVNTYPSIIDQSLKLQIMKYILEENSGEWTEEIANDHKIEMIKILRRNNAL